MRRSSLTLTASSAGTHWISTNPTTPTLAAMAGT